ncbi:MORC family CW-type zinc finger protein 3-like [Hordeum vulgare subsp. vulgare]|uniref:CW-type domain-containing protein n=1 Tax=Hordeum vulgare subsp. vulgare TaxID=112509 RepID=A0A8I7BJQ0_HORVV|nr:MORC family CW-type zinc finger protein 3-like [Hordeum vulgare subsp. vulgare]
MEAKECVEGIDLNEPPHKNRGVRLSHVLLQKDCKNICRTKACDVSIELPSLWSISNFVSSKVYELNNFTKFSLYPDPEDARQSSEWGKFMHFLWHNQRAGIVRHGSFTFHILPAQSEERPNYSHAVILYETEQKDAVICKRRTGISEKSNKTEEICDSVPNPRGLNASHIHHDPESSPCESVEDGNRISDSLVKRGTSTLRRNFVSTDPTYLRTLSQTHAGWIFGAIAELIDNSRDAGASRLDIFIQTMFSKKAAGKVPVLSVIDDGRGMTYPEMMRMISFGHKRPNEHCSDQIGRFGIGFKTGAMKLGKDAIVLTQTSTSRSVSFLSQSFNENKDNLEIPVVTYRKEGQYMEVDLSVQSEATAEYNLKAIKEFSPFNEYFIGEKLGLFGEEGTGTQIYIWNLDRWGKNYTLDWNSGRTDENPIDQGRGDILIRSKRVRSRPGQTSKQVPLDYSLHSYLEVIFRNPRMKITVQGSQVKARPLDKSLNTTSVISGDIAGRTIELTIGMSKLEWERTNCGVFLYWRGRLIESYKRVGGQMHNADTGRGVIGVADITELVDDEDGNSWVLNSKQGFQDCEMYAELEEWLGSSMDEYWETNFDNVELEKAAGRCKPDHEWVQCYGCRKWRLLTTGFDTESLPDQWFCLMPPFNGKCTIPEQQMGHGSITIGEKRSGNVGRNRITQREATAKVDSYKIGNNEFSQDEDVKNVKLIPTIVNKRKNTSNGANSIEDDLDGNSSQTESVAPLHVLKRIRRGGARSCKT